METISLGLEYDFADKKRVARYLAGIDREPDDSARRPEAPVWHSTTEEQEKERQMMKKLLKAICTFLVLLVVAGFSAKVLILDTPPDFGKNSSEAVLKTGFTASEERIPLTFTGFNDHGKKDFVFAVTGDREGGERPGIIEKVLRKAGEFDPEFVVSVGDSIPGYVENQLLLNYMWTQFDHLVQENLTVPFFRIVGNHDMGFPVMKDVWAKRYGALYYHFVYKNVLFLCMNSEDPEVPLPDNVINAYKDLLAMQEVEPESERFIKARAEFVAMSHKAMPPQVSVEQLAYFKQALEDHNDVRWTFVFIHKPLWEWENNTKTRFKEIEQMLQNRPYTVIAGHNHYYDHTVRNDRDYITMGAAGGNLHGVGIVDHGNYDHVTLIRMNDSQPAIENYLLDGTRLNIAGTDSDGHRL